MQNANRFTPNHGCLTILVTACWLMPLAAKEPQAPAALEQRELAKRRAAIEEAEELLTKGDQAYQAGRYADAVAAFSGARELIPESPLTAELRGAATERFAKASVAHAQTLSRNGDVAGAKAAVDAVLKPGVAPDDPGAIAMRNKLDDPIRTNPTLTKEHSADVDSVRRLLYTAEGAYNLGKFAEADKHYQDVLRIDPTNSAARRGMEQVAAAKDAYQKAAKDQTRAEMLNQVAAAWELAVPPPTLDVTAVNPTAPAQTGTFIPVANKLDRIVLPNIILEKASLQEAIDLLRLRSTELDTFELDPARRGINFHIDIGGDDSESAKQISAMRFNMRLTNVPISQVLRYINDQTHTTYTTDDFTVVIRPHGFESKDLVTRTYRVPPDFLTNMSANGDAAAKNPDPFAAKPTTGLLAERRGALEVLREQGIDFPEGASASFNPANSTLRVVNTAANQDIISQLVDASAKTEPVMVCVRVTMIHARENRLKELGFDWLVSPMGFGGNGWMPGTSNFAFSGGTKGNGGSMADIPIPSNQFERNPLTAGNRSGDQATYQDSIDKLIEESNEVVDTSIGTPRAPGIFLVSKVLSDRSVQMLMRGLDQKKGVDIMTSSATVTRSGQASNIRSVREMMYPTEYEPPQLPQASNTTVIVIGGGLPAAGNRQPQMVTPSHPTAFEKREVGVTLEVTPTADPSKRYVDVTLNPSVVDFDGFVNYGSPIFVPPDTTGLATLTGASTSRTLLTENRILMPVFSVHRTATSLAVADGATIVIGGLLQNRVQNVEDKTRLFGEIPIVGRLFQSKVNQPISTAVVFLVNIQLVDPTGQPFNKH